jgi:hypothetical protein
MIFLLVAGIGILVAGLLAIALGIPVKEFSFGNTLILAGVIAACTGTMILALFAAVRELKIASFSSNSTAEQPQSRAGERYRPVELPDEQPAAGFQFDRDRQSERGEPAKAPPRPDEAPAPWQDEAAGRQRDAGVPVEPPSAEPTAKQRRNLLFSSSRRERERAAARASDPDSPDAAPDSVPPAAMTPEPPPAKTFEEAWPQPERARPDPVPRRPRSPAPIGEPEPAPTAADFAPSAPREEPQGVTVLKSGVVDGMAYSLYSDGSIEAQMPEGMMRFGSIDELRTHLDQRP